MPILDTFLKIAEGEVGVREEGGNNRGKRVEEYQKATGGSPGEPWCADFVEWCRQRAGVPPEARYRSGYCPAIETWAKQKKILFDQPQIGDQFLLYDSDGPYHTGIVVDIPSLAVVSTIEGNTNSGGSAEGDGVWRRSRPRVQCRFVRWANLLPPGANKQAAPKYAKLFRHQDDPHTFTLVLGSGLPKGEYIIEEWKD